MEAKETTGVRPSWARVLLILPFVAVLWVPFYNSIEPKVFGIPFFYTWQLLWVLLGTVVVGIVYRLEH